MRTNKSAIYVERILLICGKQNAGKSRLLRQMLGDPRLGGLVPERGRIANRALSRERCLAARATSPHEAGHSPSQFHDLIAKAFRLAEEDGYRRLNYVSAVQPNAANAMPNIVGVCGALIKAFNPERIRVVQLAPDQLCSFDSQLTPESVSKLRDLDVEVLAIDARRSEYKAEPGNIRILADFFDFS